jgi:hypothetical protein
MSSMGAHFRVARSKNKGGTCSSGEWPGVGSFYRVVGEEERKVDSQ